jgi:hypothetical protein
MSDPDDEFRIVDIDLLVDKYSSAERRRFWSFLYSIKDALSKLLSQQSMYRIYKAQEKIHNFRLELGVVDDLQRLQFIENELSGDKQIRDRQITYLLDSVNRVYRRYNSLRDLNNWPDMWDDIDIAEAKDQSCYSSASISTLIRRLFIEDIQLMVAFTTTTSWVLQYYSDRNIMF